MRAAGANESPDTAHYPWVTRLLLSLFAEGKFENVAEVVVEPRYGYIGRIRYHNGAVRPFTGGGLEGLNNLAASRIARDKGWTRFFLETLGYQCPKGEKFVLEGFAERLNRRLSRPRWRGYLLEDQALAYLRENLEFPVYVKPAKGSQGRGVFRCRDESEVTEALEFYRENEVKLEGFLVEEAIAMPDFRVIVVDHDVICTYERRPLAVVGDGTSTVLELVTARQEELGRMGRPERIRMDDARLVRNVAAAGYDLDAVIPSGLRLELLEVSNLSAGGDAVDFTGRIHAQWAELCVAVTADFGLHLCGVDLACRDITAAGPDYAILELNSSPGLDNYLTQGEAQEKVVRELYRRVFDRYQDLPVAPPR